MLDEPLGRLEQASALDPVVEAVRAAVNRALGPRRLRDQLHGVGYGHPVHPALVQLPLGCWLSASILDLAGPATAGAARLLVGVGLAGTLPAAVAGAADWTDLHPQQMRVGLVHATANLVATGCYAASLAARRRGRPAAGPAWSAAGLAAAGIGGYLGAHLAYRQAAGPNHTEHVPHMVPEGWVDVAAEDELPDGVMVERQVGRVPLLLLRRGGTVHALADECPHLSGPLHEGELTDPAGEPCVRCPWHASVFRLRDGAVVHGPATAPAPVWQTELVGGRVRVRLPGAG